MNILTCETQRSPSTVRRLRNSLPNICSISQLCIPFTLNEHELDQPDNIIERKTYSKIPSLIKAGDISNSIYAIRSGIMIKSYTISETGEEQITSFITW